MHIVLCSRRRLYTYSMKVYEFPKDFIWGTAMSAYQTEGNNTNTDWYQWEAQKNPEEKYPLEPCGIACDSYNRYNEDFELCEKLNNNAVRISIEWARIEPEHGRFNHDEIEHYRKVLKTAKMKGLKTFVTLHHFTNPAWFAQLGGWLNVKSPAFFKTYAKKCAEEYGGLIDMFCTINEPQVLALLCYTNGTWPPNRKSFPQSLLVQTNLMRAHSAAYDEIKKVGNYKVGIVKNIQWFYTADDSTSPSDKSTVAFMNFINSDFFLMPIKRKLDFIGLNFYFTTRIKNGVRDNLDDLQNDLGWWIYPKGLECVLLNLKKYNLPIYITENGTADAWDKIRKSFIKDMLISCHNALMKGVKVKGYFYWSLIDNYEWHQGYWPRFGLVEVDRDNNLMRKPRPSYYYYAEICRNGKIEV
jgi:beta-glucosidase